MEVQAQLNHLRMPARKVRLATQFIRGLDVVEAQQQLQFSPRAASRPVLKLLNSALANALKNHELQKDNLFVKNIIINEGTTLKRYRARAFGRAAVIRKRASHITIILGEKKLSAKKKTKKGLTQKTTGEKEVLSYEEIKQAASSGEKSKFQEVKKEKKPFLSIKEIKDKFIRRSGER